MSARFDLFMKAMQASNVFVARLALFAIFAVIAYRILDWTPFWMRRPVKYLYLASLLAAFVFTTVFFGWAW
ncbi:MAG: hypothetical protein HY865_00935 [Chloroflexi bacterium]|nr:hypothetical protein [Chloroflexota bacterium]